MATNAKYKVKNGAVWEQIHFETTPSQVIGLMSGDTININMLPQIPESHLPDYLFTGTGFIGTYTESGTTGTLQAILGTMDNKQPVGAPDIWYEGKYVILAKNLTISPGTYLNKDLEFESGTTDDGESPSGNSIALEAGDFIFCTSYGASVVKFGVVNNTYRDATTSKQGVVTLTAATTHDGLDSTNKVITEMALRSIVFPVSAGGTGASTLTANRVLLGNGTSAISAMGSAGTAGQVLTSNGTSAPTWQTPTDNDTKNTAGSSNLNGKLFVIGTVTQSSVGPQSFSNSYVYIDDSKLHANDFVFSRDSKTLNPNVVIVSSAALTAANYKDGDVWIETLGN